MNDGTTETIDVNALDLESHVERAWYIARALGWQPINAAQCIQAACIIGGAEGSAFSELKKLFVRLRLPDPPDDEALQLNNPEIILEPALAASYRTAQPIIAGSRMWGRDFITIMVLASGDPSLPRLAARANLTVESLQDAWFQFVAAGTHRNDVWETWWRAAGVPLPRDARITRDDTCIQVAQVEKAWEMPLDALVLPAASTLDDIGGSFVTAFMGDLDESTRAELGERLRPFPTGLHYKRPATITLPEALGKRILPRSPGDTVKVVTATVRGDDGDASLDHVKPMTRSLVNLAVKEKIQHIAMPLLGPQATGAGPGAVAEQMLEELTEVDDFGSLKSIVLVVLDEEIVEAARVKFNLLTNNLAQPVSNDEPAQEDLLFIADEVHALAEMLLLKKVKPPVAVGILGGWGSGKSTVMSLMQVKMDEIRALPVEEGKGWTDETPYAGHVYQIVFNAWTYAKSNLWASLMQQIFFELNRQLSLEAELQKDGYSLLHGGPLWKILRDQKKKNRAALRQTEDALAFLKATQEDAQAARRSAVAHHIARDAVKDRLEAVLRGFSKGVAKQFFETPGAPDREKVNEVFDELKGIKKTALKVVKTIGGSWSGALALVVCVLLGVGVYFLADELTAQSTYRALITQVASASGALFPLILIITRIVGVYRRSIDSIVDEYQRSVEKTPMDKRLAGRRAGDDEAVQAILQKEALTPADKLTLIRALADDDNPQAVQEILKKKREPGEQRKESPENKVAQIQALADQDDLKAIQEILKKKEPNTEDKETLIQALADDGNLAAIDHRLAYLEARAQGQRQQVGSTAAYASLFDFVQARQDEEFYATKLGLMHQVKADLDELTAGLTIPEEDEIRALTDEEVKEANKAKKALFSRGEPRVILYIDDLDRCPPTRVVEVMEAVQLLLNTKLFVVVLGLDTRYVTRALEKEYKEILQREGDPSGLDYIEKILQIPYRVRPIDPKGLANFLKEQMDVAGDDGTGDDTQTDADDTGSGAGNGAGSNGEEPETNGTDTITGRTPLGSPPLEELTSQVVKFSPEDRLDLTTCCQQLNLTPRSIKRLVNVLKLAKIFWFRIRKGDQPRPVKQTVIGLLALSAAYPEIMREAFVQLDLKYRHLEKSPDPIIDYLSEVSVPDHSWHYRRFLIDLEALRAVEVNGEPFSFGQTTLADLKLSTFNLVRSFSFVGDPTYTTNPQTSEPPPAGPAPAP